MKITGPSCKNCRRFEAKLCNRPPGKCAWEKRRSRFGKFGSGASRRDSQYRLQLVEKQKAKYIYNVTERQFRNYYREAARQSGITGDVLMTLLEGRFDNTIYRLGFAKSRAQARQNITHGHYKLNGRKLDLPACQVKVGDKIEWHESLLSSKLFENIKDGVLNMVIPEWLKRDGESKSGEILSSPVKSEEDTLVNTRLIVEYYSRR